MSKMMGGGETFIIYRLNPGNTIGEQVLEQIVIDGESATIPNNFDNLIDNLLNEKI